VAAGLRVPGPGHGIYINEPILLGTLVCRVPATTCRGPEHDAASKLQTLMLHGYRGRRGFPDIASDCPNK
jgi:hypothetical protein